MYCFAIWDWSHPQWPLWPVLLVTQADDLCHGCGGRAVELSLEWLGMGVGLGLCLQPPD